MTYQSAVVWVGVLTVATVLWRGISRRMNRNKPINVGRLSDSWLAEQRGQRNGDGSDAPY
jgi:hypothetical protein